MNIAFKITLWNLIVLLCSVVLLLAILPLPSFYYWILRWIVMIGALYVAWNRRDSLSKVFTFLLIAYLFNPIFPVFTYEKYRWIAIDLICGILFVLETQNRVKKSSIKASKRSSTKSFGRDKYY